MIRVMVVDDHAIVRQGLERLLATTDDLELVGMAADGAEAVELAGRVAPDVVLMDLSMAGTDGVEATRQIVAHDDHVRVVVLTSFGEEQRIAAALDAGAQGYLLKHIDPDDLLAAIRASSPATCRSTRAPVGCCSTSDDARAAPTTSPSARRRSCDWWARALPTSRSPVASASASAPSRPT